MRRDRHRPLDSRLLAARGELPALREEFLAHPRARPTPADAPDPAACRLAYEANARRFGRAVAAVRSRGGRVAPVRFPAGGEFRAPDRARFPRAEYRDRLADLTGAETVHFEDVPGLGGFDCPDTSRLDRRDVPAFTAAPPDELERRPAAPPPRRTSWNAAACCQSRAGNLLGAASNDYRRGSSVRPDRS